jgi:hypothetical protein
MSSEIPEDPENPYSHPVNGPNNNQAKSPSPLAIIGALVVAAIAAGGGIFVSCIGFFVLAGADVLPGARTSPFWFLLICGSGALVAGGLAFWGMMKAIKHVRRPPSQS